MNPVLLIILDGWGYSSRKKGNAILQACTPNLDRFYRSFPWALLDAAGEAVGLPEGQMGNSEVGHLNLGAGRVVYQELTRISKAIHSGDFFTNVVLRKAVELSLRRGGALHLMGLVSNGGVHSHLDHLLALLDLAEEMGHPQVYVHAILDGRDVLPASAAPFLEILRKRCRQKQNGWPATIVGRYFAMDRDRRWSRTQLAYRAYAYGEGIPYRDPLEALKSAYERGETDEFVKPLVMVDSGGQPLATVHSDDSIIFFNFRPDRARQISRAFVDREFAYFDRGESPPFPYYVTMTEYDRTLPVPVAFPPEYLDGTLGEIVSAAGFPQLRVAETEKYAHVTFFFNGGREKPFDHEERLLVPSPPVATYDLQPEMSAPGVTREVLRAVEGGRFPFLVVNYANADMVGHTGNLPAAIRAVETVDRCLGEVAAAALPRGWKIVICGDHGNAEHMQDDEGGPHTAHTPNPVTLLVLGEGDLPPLRREGILADVAPTVLELAGLPCAPKMTGSSMFCREHPLQKRT